MPNKKPNTQEEASQRPELAADDANQENEQIITEDESSPSSLQHTSSQCSDSSASASANSTGDLSYVEHPNEPRTEPDGRTSAPSTSFPVKDRFLRVESESTEVQESRSNFGLTASTNRPLVLSPPSDERPLPDTLDVPPRGLDVSSTTVTKNESTGNLPASKETGARPKVKLALGDAFSKLRVHFSPKKDKPASSGMSASPDNSISADTSPSGSSDKQKSKMYSALRFLLGKEKSPKNSPEKKESPPVENAVNPKKLFLQRFADEASDQLCDIENPSKTNHPKDSEKVDNSNSDTTADSLSTQCTITTDPPMSVTLSSNQGDLADQAIPESPKPESDKDEKSNTE